MRAPALAQANRTPTHGPEHDTVYETAEALNELQDLKQLVLASLAKPLLVRSRRSPLAHFVTRSLISRVYAIVGKMDKTARGGLGEQAALARVINDFMHGCLPDVESLEQCGQEMWNTAVRDHGSNVKTLKERVRKARTDAGRLANATELAALHLAHYTCQRGATTNDRRTTTPMTVHTADPLASEVLMLRREATSLLAANNELKRKADSSKRDRERADEADATARDALQQLKATLVAAAAAAEQAAVELATELVERAEGKAAAARSKLEIEIAARREATRKAAAAEAERKSAVVKQQGHTVSALKEAERCAQALREAEADFEAAVERR